MNKTEAFREAVETLYRIMVGIMFAFGIVYAPVWAKLLAAAIFMVLMDIEGRVE